MDKTDALRAHLEREFQEAADLLRAGREQQRHQCVIWNSWPWWRRWWWKVTGRHFSDIDVRPTRGWEVPQ